ncbi:hypothetical protein [Streptomyces sp. DH8]|uniref:hypothetical protein n=1 Tax=Streptomyces sp. DH8 TaxID=2857008 RepID=UPI001E5AD670|nr:hypothetical protein [Streptomyces sp. DH8]
MGPPAPTGRTYVGDHLADEVTASDFGKVSSAAGKVADAPAPPLARTPQRLNGSGAPDPYLR